MGFFTPPGVAKSKKAAVHGQLYPTMGGLFYTEKWTWKGAVRESQGRPPKTPLLECYNCGKKRRKAYICTKCKWCTPCARKDRAKKRFCFSCMS